MQEDEGEGEVGQEEGEGEVEGQGEVELESEGEREPVSQEIEVEVGDQREEESGARDSDSDAKDDYSQRVVTSRRRDVVESGSEENHFNENDGEEVDAARSLRYIHLVFLVVNHIVGCAIYFFGFVSLCLCVGEFIYLLWDEIFCL